MKITKAEIQLALQQLTQAVNDTRIALDQLAQIQGYEWVNDLKTFVSKEKLDDLKKNPR